MFFLYDILYPGPLCRRHKRCEKSLDLEPPLRAGFLYAYGIIKIGRNALAFLGNAVDERRLRTTWGSVVAK